MSSLPISIFSVTFDDEVPFQNKFLFRGNHGTSRDSEKSRKAEISLLCYVSIKSLYLKQANISKRKTSLKFL